MFDQLIAYPEVVAAIEKLGDARKALLDLCIAVQQIAAPTFAEAERANWVLQRFRALELIRYCV